MNWMNRRCAVFFQLGPIKELEIDGECVESKQYNNKTRSLLLNLNENTTSAFSITLILFVNFCLP